MSKLCFKQYTKIHPKVKLMGKIPTCCCPVAWKRQVSRTCRCAVRSKSRLPLLFFTRTSVGTPSAPTMISNTTVPVAPARMAAGGYGG